MTVKMSFGFRRLDLDMTDPDDFITVLALLKFAGFIITGVSGVLASLTKIREDKIVKSLIIGAEEKVEIHLTRWGKINISMIIVGVLLACGAQFAETRKEKIEGARSQRATQESLRLAQTSLSNLEVQGEMQQVALDQIQKLVTRLEDVSVELECDVPANGFVITNRPSTGQAGQGNVVGYINGPNGSEIVSYSEAVEFTNGPNGIMAVETNSENADPTIPISITINDLAAAAIPEHFPKKERGELLHFLEFAAATMQIWRDDTKVEGRGPDFTASSGAGVITDIEYLRSSNRLRVKWRFEFPREDWKTNHKVSSLVWTSVALWCRSRLDICPPA